MTDKQSTLFASDFHFDELTGLRGIAASCVLVYHCWGVSGLPIRLGLWGHTVDVTPLFAMGWMGVDIFFVLSGFLLGWHALSLGPRFFSLDQLRGYVERRVFRVYPAFLAQFIVLIGLVSLALYPVFTLRTAVAHLLFVSNFCESSCAAIVYVWWSLPVEFDFYLALPILLLPLVLRVNVWVYLAAGFAISMAVTYVILEVLPFDFRGQIHQLPARLIEFSSGIAAAAIACKYREQIAARSSTLFAVGIAVAAALIWLAWRHIEVLSSFGNHWATYAFRPVLSLAVVLMMLSSIGHGRAAKLVLGNRAIVFIGTVSYSLYLWHTVPLYWLRDHNYFNSWGLGTSFIHLQVFSYVVPVALCVATASYFLFERPFLRRDHSAASKRRLLSLGFVVVLLGSLIVAR